MVFLGGPRWFFPPLAVREQLFDLLAMCSDMFVRIFDEGNVGRKKTGKQGTARFKKNATQRAHLREGKKNHHYRMLESPTRERKVGKWAQLWAKLPDNGFGLLKEVDQALSELNLSPAAAGTLLGALGKPVLARDLQDYVDTLGNEVESYTPLSQRRRRIVREVLDGPTADPDTRWYNARMVQTAVEILAQDPKLAADLWSPGNPLRLQRALTFLVSTMLGAQGQALFELQSRWTQQKNAVVAQLRELEESGEENDPEVQRQIEMLEKDELEPWLQKLDDLQDTLDKVEDRLEKEEEQQQQQQERLEKSAILSPKAATSSSAFAFGEGPFSQQGGAGAMEQYQAYLAGLSLGARGGQFEQATRELEQTGKLGPSTFLEDMKKLEAQYARRQEEEEMTRKNQGRGASRRAAQQPSPQALSPLLGSDGGSGSPGQSSPSTIGMEVQEPEEEEASTETETEPDIRSGRRNAAWSAQ